MTSIKDTLRISFLALAAVATMMMVNNPASAQSSQPLKLDFVAAGGGPPIVEVLPDGTLVFEITAIESVTGGLTGTLTEDITQVYPLADEDGLLPITTLFTLQTSAGTLKGYYSGTFMHKHDGTHLITQHGEILSVTGAYADLYQATVLYRGVLSADHMTISGRISIHSRAKR